MQKNTYTGPDDVMLCGKPEVFVTVVGKCLVWQTIRLTQRTDDDGEFGLMYNNSTHTYGTAQAAELLQWWHQYFYY